MVLIPSARARGWVKVKLAKHLFEHRYDYRAEWLRFTETLGHCRPRRAAARASGSSRPSPTSSMLPGGLLLVSDGGRGSLAVAASGIGPAATPAPRHSTTPAISGAQLEESGRIAGVRAGFAEAGQAADDKAFRCRPWLLDEPCAWAAIPLLHHQRLVGLVVLAAPEYRRQLDWEDLDLLRTAGHQAASSLAEALGQEALSERPALRGVQPPLRVHPPRHQEPGQPAVAARPQRRAARRQSRLPRRHGRDAEVVRSAR